MLPAPRTDPDVRRYRIRLLLRVFGVEAVVGIWMQDTGTGKMTLHERAEAIPVQAMPLTSSPKRLVPETGHLIPEPAQRGDVTGDREVLEIPRQHPAQPRTLLADRAVEIVADRGIHAKVGAHEWERICREMEGAFRQANYEGGVINGVEAVTRHLVRHFPTEGHDGNELPDSPVML